MPGMTNLPWRRARYRPASHAVPMVVIFSPSRTLPEILSWPYDSAVLNQTLIYAAIYVLTGVRPAKLRFASRVRPPRPDPTHLANPLISRLTPNYDNSVMKLASRSFHGAEFTNPSCVVALPLFRQQHHRPFGQGWRVRDHTIVPAPCPHVAGQHQSCARPRGQLSCEAPLNGAALVLN